MRPLMFFLSEGKCCNLNLGAWPTPSKDNKMSFLEWKKLNVSKWNQIEQKTYHELSQF